jgi:hypothetical protein
MLNHNPTTETIILYLSLILKPLEMPITRRVGTCGPQATMSCETLGFSTDSDENSDSPEVADESSEDEEIVVDEPRDEDVDDLASDPLFRTPSDNAAVAGVESESGQQP